MSTNPSADTGTGVSPASSPSGIVLMCTAFGWGGTEVTASILAVEYQKRGLRPSIIVDGPPLDRLSIVEQAGIPVTVLGVQQDWSERQYEDRLSEALRTSGAKLLHCHIWERFGPIWGTAKRLGIPYVMTLHATVQAGLRHRLGLVGSPAAFAARRRAYSEYDPVMINISRLSNDNFKKVYPRVTRLNLVYQGRPAPSNPVDAGANGTEVQALWIGSFDARKLPLWAIEAWRDVLKHVPKARLIMLGGGPLWEDAKRLAKTLPPGSIELPGPVEGPEAQLLNAQILIHTGVREGIPGSIIEAVNAGIPVVAFDIGAVSEAVVHGKTGYLTAPQDKSAFARAIKELAVDATLRREMGRQARRFGEQRFNLSRCVDEHLRIYRNVCGVDCGI